MGTLWNAFMYKVWLPLVTGRSAIVEGLENIPSSPFVVMSNHQSEWETLSLTRIFRPASVVMKKSLLSIPIFGWGLRAIRPIGIDRANPRESIRAIRSLGKKRLQQGNNVLIFPEGTRVSTSEIRTYKRTAAKLAIDAGVPVLPVVHNSGDCWLPGNYFLPKSIQLRIGKPIDSKGRSPDELTSIVQQWANENYLSIRSKT